MTPTIDLSEAVELTGNGAALDAGEIVVSVGINAKWLAGFKAGLAAAAEAMAEMKINPETVGA